MNLWIFYYEGMHCGVDYIYDYVDKIDEIDIFSSIKTVSCFLFFFNAKKTNHAPLTNYNRKISFPFRDI